VIGRPDLRIERSPAMISDSVRISPPVFDGLVAYGIGGLAVLVATLFVVLFSRQRPARRLRLAIGAGIVMAASAAAAWTGLLSRFDTMPPPMAVMIAGVLAMGLVLGLSRLGADAAREVPLAHLIGFQAFRLPLELAMHRACTLGIMPPELSYSGYNFDIVTGLGAALLYLAMMSKWSVPRSVVWAWNLWGFWCLAVIFGIAVTTSPMVRLFGDDPRHVNTWVLLFPYVWLPVVMVTVAIAGHVTIARALRRAAR
jgi:hypothetical protein